MIPPICKRNGFSLLELLVAIAVVAVLIAILIPVSGNLRQNGQRIECMSRMRQLAAVVLLYSHENSGRLLPAAMGANHNMNDLIWYYNLDTDQVLPGNPNNPANEGRHVWHLDPKSIMACPARSTPPAGYWAGNGGHHLHYTVNQNPGFLNRVNSSSGRWPRLSDIASPGRTFLIAEANGAVADPNGSGFVYPHPHSGSDIVNGQGMNLVFYDGHGEYFKGRLPVIASNYSVVPYQTLTPERSFPFF